MPDLLSDDDWYYISSKIRTAAFFAPEEVERQVIAIDFDKTGTVTAIRKLGKFSDSEKDKASGP
jgi:outer membrane protein assembly factor BamE (lipoprotein component of BamABCDE complex)